MADKGKKASKGGSDKGPAKKAAGKPAASGDAPAEAAVASARAVEEPAKDDGGHGPAHAHGAAHAHGHHKPNTKEYLVIFGVLFFLTVLEVAVTKVPGIARNLMALALIGMALTKAAFVGLYFMHLKHETRVLKLTVALPLAAPTIYALVLISEAAWRLTR